MKRLAFALIASSILVAACGSNETIEVLGSTPEASADEASNSEPPTTLGFTDGNAAASSEYCKIARSLAENEAPFSIYEDPESLQTYVTGVMEGVERMEELAPPEIGADFVLVKSGLDTYHQLLIDADWDFSKASGGMQELFEDNPDFDAASAAMDEYDRDVCGIDNADDTASVTSEG